MTKYFIIILDVTSVLGGRSRVHHHTYAESLDEAKTDALQHYRDPEIIGVIEQGFDIGDRVIVLDHQIVEDAPGEVIEYAEDGWVIVEWKELDWREEFHWTELVKVE